MAPALSLLPVLPRQFLFLFEKYKKILEKRKVSLCASDNNGDFNGDFENPETLLTISQAAEKLGCTEEEFNTTLKSVCEEAERYLAKSLQSFVDNLEYVDNYEPDDYDIIIS